MTEVSRVEEYINTALTEVDNTLEMKYDLDLEWTNRVISKNLIEDTVAVGLSVFFMLTEEAQKELKLDVAALKIHSGNQNGYGVDLLNDNIWMDIKVNNVQGIWTLKREWIMDIQIVDEVSGEGASIFGVLESFFRMRIQNGLRALLGLKSVQEMLLSVPEGELEQMAEQLSEEPVEAQDEGNVIRPNFGGNRPSADLGDGA